MNNIFQITANQIIIGGNNDMTEVFPVGAIYLSVTSVNPSNYFEGTWEAFGQGRMLIGVGSGTDSRSETKSFAALETGGEYKHKLTVSEIPSHTHTMKTTGDDSSELTGTNPSNKGYVFRYNSSGTDNNNNNTGGDSAHNNLSPYIAVYMWRRIA